MCNHSVHLDSSRCLGGRIAHSAFVTLPFIDHDIHARWHWLASPVNDSLWDIWKVRNLLNRSVLPSNKLAQPLPKTLKVWKKFRSWASECASGRACSLGHPLSSKRLPLIVSKCNAPSGKFCLVSTKVLNIISSLCLCKNSIVCSFALRLIISLLTPFAFSPLILPYLLSSKIRHVSVHCLGSNLSSGTTQCIGEDAVRDRRELDDDHGPVEYGRGDKTEQRTWDRGERQK